MFDSTIETLEENYTVRYRISQDSAEVSYAQVLDLWQTDEHFKDYFTSLLSSSSFNAFRWETPTLTVETARRPFEFVLVNTPRFASRKTDGLKYREYFTDEDVVYFPNIRKDSTLIVPTPQSSAANYGHLAAFVRGADQPQTRSLWRILGSTVATQLGRTPIWVSTAGGGVAWLHARIDKRPKYYSYRPYKAV